MGYLLTPGPVEVPTFVMEAISRPVIHHRSAAFREFYSNIRNGLQYLFQTDGFTGTIIGSGTFGVEAAIYSLFRPHNRIAIVDNGKFSRRWVNYGSLRDLEIIHLVAEWGEAITKEEILEGIHHMPTLKGIVLTHCETSTGAVIDLEEIALAIRNVYPDILIVVDGITTVGAIPFYADEWQIDCAIVASQKALMNPTGTCAFHLSERAIRHLAPTHNSDFINLYNYYEPGLSNEYPYTAPTQLLYGIEAVLDHFRQTGLPAIWNEVHHAASTFRKGIERLGGKLMASNPSDSLTAFQFPEHDNEAIRQMLMRDFDFHLAGGQGPFRGKIMRASHMAGVTAETMEILLEKLALCLNQ